MGEFSRRFLQVPEGSPKVSEGFLKVSEGSPKVLEGSVVVAIKTDIYFNRSILFKNRNLKGVCTHLRLLIDAKYRLKWAGEWGYTSVMHSTMQPLKALVFSYQRGVPKRGDILSE